MTGPVLAKLFSELSGVIGSIAHLAYHLGAIRQIDKSSRGPKDGTFR